MVVYRDVQLIYEFSRKLREISQKVSAIQICYLEWDSQDPPLFPGLPPINPILNGKWGNLVKLTLQTHVPEKFPLVPMGG